MSATSSAGLSTNSSLLIGAVNGGINAGSAHPAALPSPSPSLSKRRVSQHVVHFPNASPQQQQQQATASVAPSPPVGHVFFPRSTVAAVATQSPDSPPRSPVGMSSPGVHGQRPLSRGSSAVTIHHSPMMSPASKSRALLGRRKSRRRKHRRRHGRRSLPNQSPQSSGSVSAMSSLGAATHAKAVQHTLSQLVDLANVEMSHPAPAPATVASSKARSASIVNGKVVPYSARRASMLPHIVSPASLPDHVMQRAQAVTSPVPQHAPHHAPHHQRQSSSGSLPKLLRSATPARQLTAEELEFRATVDQFRARLQAQSPPQLLQRSVSDPGSGASSPVSSMGIRSLADPEPSHLALGINSPMLSSRAPLRHHARADTYADSPAGSPRASSRPFRSSSRAPSVYSDESDTLAPSDSGSDFSDLSTVYSSTPAPPPVPGTVRFGVDVVSTEEWRALLVRVRASQRDDYDLLDVQAAASSPRP